MTPREPGAPVLLVSTQGGHLAHLLALRDWWERRDRLWVCPDTPDVVDRLAGERVVRSYSPTTRNVPNLLRNSALALEAAAPGAARRCWSAPAPASPCRSSSVAWLLRIPTVFIEVYDRVDTPTMTGRLCGPFTTRRIVQWQSQLEFYPDARPRGAAAVTQLVVALTGTDHHPFDRMVEWVDAAAVRRRDVRFVVQHGSDAPPPRVAEGHEFLAHDRLVAAARGRRPSSCATEARARSWTRARPGTCRCACPATRSSASTSTGTSSASLPWLRAKASSGPS